MDATYWICSFAVNQHDPEIGDMADSPFEEALSCVSCKRLVFVMDMQELPLGRLWCLYELVRAQELSKPIDFATPEGVINKQASLSEEGEQTIAALQVR